MFIPGLQEDSDQTAWFPTSRSLPSRSSFKISISGFATTLVAILADIAEK